MKSKLHLSSVLLGLFVALIVFGGATASAQRPLPVNIQSTPPGAMVYLDATTVSPLGVTPLRNVPVPSGAHTLIFRLDGFEEGRLAVNVRRRRETFGVTLNAMAVLVVSPSNEGAQTALIRIDGVPTGALPFRGNVQPGRHLVQVGREGYVTFSQWVDIASAQALTLPVALEREREVTGSVLVAADISGAQIFIDGTERGATPTVVEGLTPGTHRIEVRSAGLPTFVQEILITAATRASVNATLRPANTGPASGTLRVVANVAGANIALDGEALGGAPVVREGVAPGEHILEATADGYERIQQTVTIEPGQSRAVSLQLQRVVQQPGRIIVNSNVGAATVTIDGALQPGTPPIVMSTPSEGTHAVVVVAEGYDDFRTTCETHPGHDCNITATLNARQVTLKVQLQPPVPGAHLYMNNELKGPVPFEGALPAGSYQLEVRAEGYVSHIEQLRLVASEGERALALALVREGPSAEEVAAAAEAVESQQFGATTHSATPLPSDYPLVDLSIGWPYLVEARASIGLAHFGPENQMGLDAGFGIRSFGRLTEFEARFKWGWRVIKQFAFGAQVRIGGGIGPSYQEKHSAGSPYCGTDTMACTTSHDTNNFFANFEALATLNFGDRGAVTLWFATDLNTDRWDYQALDSSRLVEAENDKGEISRQAQFRVRFGGALEIVLTEHWNAWSSLEGILADSQTFDSKAGSRRIYGDIFGIGAADTEIYFRLGTTYKF